MNTLRLSSPRRKRKKTVTFNPLRPYFDHGRPGPLRYGPDGKVLRAKEPPQAVRVVLTPESLRRHNTLNPALQATNRLLLRWGESGGTGLPNPEAEIRELHYDPLPNDLQEMVDDIVSGSPWASLTRRWYRTSLTPRQLAEELCIGKTQLYEDWKSSLWYYRGRFETESVHE